MAKNVNIYIPSGKDVYYANFRRPVNDPKLGRISKQVNRSTGSSDKKTAQSIANGMRNKAMEGFFNDVPKLREDCITVGALVDQYGRSVTMASKAKVINSFLTVVAEGAGIRDPKRRDEARAIHLNRLTADSMITFRDQRDTGRADISINFLIRTARSIFSKRAMEHYRNLKLPDLTGWLNVAPLPEKTNRRFQRLDDSLLAEMDAAADGMLTVAASTSGATANQWKNAWGCYWLVRRCGLRPAEVQEFRTEWMIPRPGTDDMQIALIERDYWRPKGTQGHVPLARGLYEKLAEVFGPFVKGENRHLLLGTASDRDIGVHRTCAQFVRKYIVNREMATYELRKQWGSEIARRHGLETASSLLRHADIKTSWEHYYDDLKHLEVKPL